MAKAMYAFSGDPITFGHMDIINRGAKVFEKLVVGIGVNPDKKYTFTLEERTELAKRATSHLPNVEVLSFSGMLVDYAYENGIEVIVKGVRNSADFDYENILHQAGESQSLGIDTHILFARPELSHVSSSMVKAIQKEHGLIHEYVPLNVKQALEARISGQYVLGITGEIGCGKSYLGKSFEELGRTRGISVHNIDLDVLGHQILGTLKDPKYQEIRETIADTFGRSVMLSDGTINRKALGDIVFLDKSQLEKLNDIMYTPLIVRFRRELYDKKGLILVNAALIAEANWGYLCNNNVVLISVDKESQKRRLKKRNSGAGVLTDEQIERRLGSQYSYSQKKDYLDNAARKDKNGTVFGINNSDGADPLEIERLFESIVKELSVK